MSDFISFRKNVIEHGLAVMTAEIPADFLTPAAVFLRLGGDGARSSFLFESVETGGAVGRYSFIGIDPAEELWLTETGGVHRQGRTMRRFASRELASVIRAGLSEHRRAGGLDQSHGLAGGWVGYFGYDWVRNLERLPQKAPDHLGRPWVSLGLYDQVIVFDHVFQSAYVNLTIRRTEDRSAISARRRYDKARRSLDRTLRRLRQPQPLPAVAPLKTRAARSNLARRTFLDHVRTIKKHIGRGDIFQCVLSQRFTVDGPVRPFDVYRRLRRANPSPYLYFVKSGDLAIAGSSPETLVQKQGSRVVTRPIAGTRPRAADRREDLILERQLLASPKESAEHLMLVDLGRNDIGRVCRPGSVSVGDFRRIDRYSHVMHMVSEVSGSLRRTCDAIDLLAATFPAGTVTGAPKIRAMEIIDALEPDRRGIYAGCVGYIDWWGNMDTAIAIRTAVMDGRQSHAQAGAGIVADSDPEREYQETLNKAAAPLEALGGTLRKGRSA